MDCDELAKKLNALGLWEVAMPYSWGVKARGSAFPYFCMLARGDNPMVKVRFLMLEGWQTMHDFVLTRQDNDFGFYSSPMEFAHYELIVTVKDECVLLRHDTGYMPAVLTASQRQLVAKLLWQCYGVMMRLENDSQLTLKYADEKSIFARVEIADDVWEDRPIEIPDPRPHIEKVSFDKADVKAAADLPFMKDEIVDLDFRLLPTVMTREPKPRCVYELMAKVRGTGEKLFSTRASIMPGLGLKGIWESMPVQVLKELIRRGKIPGEIHVTSGRVFRLLRPLGMELPFKLTLHK